MWVGTFNVNGRTPGIDDDLSSWLCPASGSNVDPDIVVVGFQEIVELNPQQIMSTDPSVRQGWERLVKETLDDRARSRGSAEYALVRSGQLVGAALMIFVKATALKNIKNVEGSVKKVRIMVLVWDNYLTCDLDRYVRYGGKQRCRGNPNGIFKHEDLLRHRTSCSRVCKL